MIFYRIESVKTTSMENVSVGVLDKNKEHYLRCKDKAKKSEMLLNFICDTLPQQWYPITLDRYIGNINWMHIAK